MAVTRWKALATESRLSRPAVRSGRRGRRQIGHLRCLQVRAVAVGADPRDLRVQLQALHRPSVHCGTLPSLPLQWAGGDLGHQKQGLSEQSTYLGYLQVGGLGSSW